MLSCKLLPTLITRKPSKLPKVNHKASAGVPAIPELSPLISRLVQYPCQHPVQFGRLKREMYIRSNSGGNLIARLPTPIRTEAYSIIKVAKSRYSRYRENSSKPCYFLKANSKEPSYEDAKRAETNERNLTKALSLYAKSVLEGDRIDSCIKDFASVLHQMGYTKEGVEFLTILRSYYEGDINKYDRLRTTLERQLTPSGKHECRTIAFELPNKQRLSPELVQSLFENSSRIKNVKVFSHMAFDSEQDQEGRWFLFEFQSFSAAKKTLEKFKFDEWFGINKYWVKNNLITCEATDGREDFEKGLVVTKQMIESNLFRFWSYETTILWQKEQLLHYYNECAKMLIENDLAMCAILQEKEQRRTRPK